ncbi:unnamed protein product [Bathycoccus prasinos]
MAYNIGTQSLKRAAASETCPIHTTRMKEKKIRDELVTLKKDDLKRRGDDALGRPGTKRTQTTSPELGLERLKTKVLSSSKSSS